MTKAFCDYYYEQLDYYLKQNPYIVISAEFEIQTAIQYTSRVANACSAYGKPELGDEINKKLESIMRLCKNDATRLVTELIADQ